jgi:hypothetical protein
MNFRLTAALFGVVLVVGLVLLGLALFQDEKPPPAGALLTDFALHDVKPDQIDAVEIEKAGAGTIKFVKESDGWKLKAPVAARADGRAVEEVVAAVLNARPVAYGELTTNPNLHGLNPPGLKVTLHQGSERTATLNLGNFTVGDPMRAVVFVSTGDKPDRPLAVRKSSLDALFKTPPPPKAETTADLAKGVSDFRSRQVFTAEAAGGPDQVREVKLTAKGKDLVLTKGADGWTITQPPWGPAAPAGDATPGPDKGLTGARPIVAALLGLHAAEFVDPPGNLKQYGLEDGNPDRVRAEITLDGNRKEAVLIGKKVEGSPNQVFIKLEGDNAVIKANDGKRDDLANVVANPDPLRDRTLIHDDRMRIDAIDLTAHGGTTKLRRTGRWVLFGGPGDPKPANDEAVNKILEVLTHPRAAVGFPEVKDPKERDGPVPEQVAELKVWAGGIGFRQTDPKAEPTPTGKPTVLQFGRKGEQVYVRRTSPGGTKADFLLPRDLLPPDGKPLPVTGSVARTRLELLSPVLEKSFAEVVANRLTIAHAGTVVLEIERGGPEPMFPTGRWAFVKPDTQKGQTADQTNTTDLLHQLATLRASEFKDEAADDKKLAGYGLDPKAPRVRVTVGLKSETDKERVYDFGNEAGGFVYARQGGSQAVFTVPKAAADPFLTPDLRDRTVVRFDPAKAKRLRVRAWKDTTGQVLVREFEKNKDGVWAPVDPKDYPVDGAKVDAFIREVAGLRAKGYPAKPGPPEYKLAPEAGGMEIVIVTDGGPPEYRLNIGALVENGASRVGSTGAAPNDAFFTVGPDVLKPFRENAGSFAR